MASSSARVAWGCRSGCWARRFPATAPLGAHRVRGGALVVRPDFGMSPPWLRVLARRSTRVLPLPSGFDWRTAGDADSQLVLAPWCLAPFGLSPDRDNAADGGADAASRLVSTLGHLWPEPGLGRMALASRNCALTSTFNWSGDALAWLVSARAPRAGPAGHWRTAVLSWPARPARRRAEPLPFPPGGGSRSTTRRASHT